MTKQARSSDKGKQLTTLLIIAIIIIALLISALVYFYPKTKSIVGTYCTGSGLSEDDIYFAFLGDNTYVQYKQFSPMDSGEYTLTAMDGFFVVSITSEDGSEQILYYSGSKSLIVPDDSITDGFLEYTRISDTPTLINLAE